MPLDNLTEAEASAREEQLGEVRYHVALTLSDDTSQETYVSRTVVEFDSSEPGGSTFINLSARSVTSIRLNGKEVPLSAFHDDRIEIAGLQEHNTLEIVANCVYDTHGVGLHRKADPTDGKVYCYSNFEPFDAHRMFACFDQPDLKATYEFEVTAPPQWTVISNENVDSVSADGATTRFKTTEKISTYLSALIAGPYKKISTTYKGIEISLYARASMFQYLERDADEIFEITKQGLDYYEKAFGRPYPFSKYDHIFVPEFNPGAMENPGAITYNEYMLFRSKPSEAELSARADTILHEMAHMWFGDLVTMKWWKDLWLNESFATVMSLYALVGATKYAERAMLDFADTQNAWALNQDQLSSTHPIASGAADVLTAKSNFDGITYAKGAAVLRQLVAWLGEDVVFGGLREYFQTYAWKNATLDDLLNVWQKHAGPSKDIFAWAKLWLTTTGPNTLTGQRVDSKGDLGYSILQTPAGDPPQLRPHHIVVGAYDRKDGKLVRTKTAIVEVTGAVTDVAEFAGETHDLYVVNDDALTYAKVRLDKESLAAAVTDVQHLDGALPRVLVWSSAWDMVRDGEMPARQFADMVRSNIALEKDPDTAAGHLGDAASAVAAFGDQANYVHAATAVADSALEQLKRAEPGGQLQLSLAKAFVSCAESDAQLEYVRALYFRSMVEDAHELNQMKLQFDFDAAWLQGLDVKNNIDLQWQMVSVLAQAGKIDAAVIEKQAARDQTNIGADRALTAMAARPDAAVKAAAWERVVNDRSLSLKSYGALMRGLMSVDNAHESLLDGYIDKYVEELPKVWKERSIEEAEAFTSSMFPRYRGRARILELAEKLAARRDLPETAQRQLAERRDLIVRQAKAQEVDRQCAANGQGIG